VHGKQSAGSNSNVRWKYAALFSLSLACTGIYCLMVKK
jgi:hypothetical protein